MIENEFGAVPIDNELLVNSAEGPGEDIGARRAVRTVTGANFGEGCGHKKTSNNLSWIILVCFKLY